MPAGRFVAFEGLDGSGKSTQVGLLARRLRTMGLPVQQTAEPTPGPVGSIVRQALTGRLHLDHRTIAALFAADRLDHILNDASGMLQAVTAGTHVLTDRYYLSSYAYHAPHAPLDWVIAANSLGRDLMRPDVHVFLDVDPAACSERLRASGRRLELYETAETLREIRRCYQAAFDRVAGEERIEVVPGGGPADEVAGAVWERLRPLFEAG
jgi:dTMP kinase